MRFRTQAELDAFLATLTLAKGNHEEAARQYCVMEAAA